MFLEFTVISFLKVSPNSNCFILALKPLEAAERNRKHPIMLHKLPVVSPTSTVASSSIRRVKDPPGKATVLIIAGGVHRDIPIIPNTGSIPASIKTQTGSAIGAHAYEKSKTSGGHNKRVVANPALVDLHRNGLLPGRWQILTKPNKKNTNKRKK